MVKKITPDDVHAVVGNDRFTVDEIRAGIAPLLEEGVECMTCARLLAYLKDALAERDEGRNEQMSAEQLEPYRGYGIERESEPGASEGLRRFWYSCLALGITRQPNRVACEMAIDEKLSKGRVDRTQTAKRLLGRLVIELLQDHFVTAREIARKIEVTFPLPDGVPVATVPADIERMEGLAERLGNKTFARWRRT